MVNMKNASKDFQNMGKSTSTEHYNVLWDFLRKKKKTGGMMHIPVKNVFLSTMWYLKKKYNMILSNNECCFIFF